MSTENMITLLKYKRWIDAETLATVAGIDEPAYADMRHRMLRLMNHIYVVDAIFKANILGQPHGYTALSTPETPVVAELQTKMAETTDWYIRHVETLQPEDFNARIAFRFVDGGAGAMTAGDMLHHVLFHGTYHRGAVGWLISECGRQAPRDVLTVYLRDHHS
ncbi:DinB family protein [Candidatus Pantoea soli]|uniref:Diguanylate cyclase n=1 Tax=Candidatus Pantoea soli TaxID=3098669 RepID=A0A518XJ33_9GAMM|nr:DinB family protein [Pantoea soli]QDY44195.1 diguanylate cyclase [Pantoea soli]